MPKMTPGLAKNHIRRALRAVVDPEPRSQEIADLWEYFDSSCAYCGCTLNKHLRNGHIDHLVHDGANHISNRVLSCPTCNGDEKRESKWLEFLAKKVEDKSVYKIRKEKIESWISSRVSSKPLSFDGKILEQEINRVIEAFDAAVMRLRSYRGRNRE